MQPFVSGIVVSACVKAGATHSEHDVGRGQGFSPELEHKKILSDDILLSALLLLVRPRPLWGGAYHQGAYQWRSEGHKGQIVPGGNQDGGNNEGNKGRVRGISGLLEAAK